MKLSYFLHISPSEMPFGVRQTCLLLWLLPHSDQQELDRNWQLLFRQTQELYQISLMRNSHLLLLMLFMLKRKNKVWFTKVRQTALILHVILRWKSRALTWANKKPKLSPWEAETDASKSWSYQTTQALHKSQLQDRKLHWRQDLQSVQSEVFGFGRDTFP